MRSPATPPTPPVPSLPKSTPLPVETPPTEASPNPVTVGAPDAAADDLQRLAALAMAQLGEDNEESAPEEAAELVAKTAPIPPAAIQEEEPEPVSAAAPEPEPLQEQEALPSAPEPEPAPEAPEPVYQPQSVSTPPPPVKSSNPPEFNPPPSATEQPTAESRPASVAINLNKCTPDDLLQIPDCSRELAEAIVQHRTSIGSFKKLEDLLDVPGMTKGIYQSLTGEAPPDAVSKSLNELLGFPADHQPSLKDITDRISCWPDVTGCVLSQSSGLSLVGNVPAGLDKAAIVAFAPRIFESLNKSFGEIAGKETDELIIPSPGTSFHIFRNKDLYLIILSRLPQMPDRHMKVARFVLAWLGIRQN
jgi:DNA uptake protein ComE-like DNA-binding protein